MNATKIRLMKVTLPISLSLGGIIKVVSSKPVKLTASKVKAANGLH